MEFGDSQKKPSGIKARLFHALDPAAKQEKADAMRQAKEETLRARQARIEEEKQYRAEVRSGKRSSNVRSYIGSVLTEKRESAKARRLAEDLNPQLKTARLQDREIRNIESRQKWRKRFAKVDNVFDTINNGLDTLGGTGSKKGSGGGLSDRDIAELSGLGGNRKTKSNGGGFGFDFGGGRGGGMSKRDLDDLSGLSGTMFGSSQPRRRSKSRTKTSTRKRSRRASKPRSIFDIEI